MNIVFRTDASNEIGTGHVMRCLTLADELKKCGAKCIFVCRQYQGNLLSLIINRGHKALGLPDCHDIRAQTDGEPSHASWLGCDWVTDVNQTNEVLGDILVGWFIVDHYAIDHQWESVMRSRASHIMVIDDLADRHHECDILLDQNWFAVNDHDRYQGYVSEQCLSLLGPKYALLGPEYSYIRSLMPPRDGLVHRILVFMGGSDPTNETYKVLTALQAKELSHLSVDVVFGSNYSNIEDIKLKLVQRPNTSMHHNLRSLAGLMMKSDLMISAGGATSWERMCLGLPAIVISIASNQTLTNVALSEAGYIQFLGEKEKVNSKDIEKKIIYSIMQNKLLKDHSIRMQKLVDGKGSLTVANYLINYSH